MKRALVLAWVLVACGGDVKTPAQLQDPNTCLECHQKHHDQWSGSMHAYASDDPVFVAMNKRGQRDTGGALGTFCLNCHAPIAVANKTYTDANAGDFDPTTLPPGERGVTCYFCHNVDKITADHNNGLVLANDSTMRGGLKNPVDSPAHNSSYDKLMDSDLNESEMCGSCHDIVTPKGVPLERTYTEWQTTFFATLKDATHHLTCGGCHMKASGDVLADKAGLAVPFRPNGFHEHLWPGIDEALTPFPNQSAMSTGIEDILKGAIAIAGPSPRTGPPAPGGICLDPPGTLSIRIDSVGTGHKWPSGAAHDRRAWLEVTAFRADNSVVFQSGVVPDGMDPDEITDPNLFGMWDRTTQDNGMPAHFFWDVGHHDDTSLIRGPTTLVQTDPAFDHSTTKKFTIANYTEIDHIVARVRIRALPFKLLDELVAGGDLDPSIASKLKTLDIAGTLRHWDKATSGMPGSPAALTNCSPYDKY